jgi:hypothetical protein
MARSTVPCRLTALHVGSIKSVRVPNEGMQECGVCGLLFGGTDECPSCGSRVSHLAEKEIEGGDVSAPSGPLPGKSALDEAKAGMTGLDLGLAIELPKSSGASLPFQVGGVGEVASNLPFGVGASAGIITDSVEDDSVEPAPDEPEDASDTMMPLPSNEPTVEDDDPWAVSEPTSLATLEVKSEGTTSVEEESPMVVLQARPIIIEEEQLSESPVLVENAFQIHAEELDSEHVYVVEDDVIVHDFGDELQVSEVIVNFDELVDPADQTIRFDHELLSEGEPELMPAKALPIDDGGDARIAGHSIAAFEALAEGRWQDAADGFRIVCNELPGDPAALNDFGLALRQMAMQVHESNPTQTPAEEPHFEAAVLALRQAAQQDRHNPTILYNLATCLATCGRHGVATRIWDASITLSPQDPAPLNGKAVSLVAQGEFDAASALLMRAREIAPSEPIILRNLRRLRPTA